MNIEHSNKILTISLADNKMATPIINCIRRALLSETPTNAIGSVIIYRNATAMADEILSQRLGLIPLKCPRDLQSGKIQLEFTNTTSGNIWLKSEEIKSSDGIVAIPDLPIVLLGPGHGVNLVAIVSKGIGRMHAKYSPVMMNEYTTSETKGSLSVETRGGVLPLEAFGDALCTLRKRTVAMRNTVNATPIMTG